MFYIWLFGTTRVLAHDRRLGPRDLGGAKPRAILEVLALRRGQPTSKDALVEVLWRDRPPRLHVATLESYVSLLRSRLEPGTPVRSSVIRTVPGGYHLDPGRTRTDLDLFDALVDRAHAGGGSRLFRLLDRASELGSRGLLAASGDTPWAEAVRADYQQRAVRAAVRAAEHALAVGRADDAGRLARRALALDQFCESAWRALMLAHGATGRRDAAVRAYRVCRHLLAEGLGIDPAPETRRVLESLVRRRGRTAGGAAPQEIDLGTVLDAALDLFERSPSTHAGSDSPDQAARVMLSLLRRVGVDPASA